MSTGNSRMPKANAFSPAKQALLRRCLRGRRGGRRDSIARRSTPEPAPLSFAQQRVWFLEQLEPGTPVYNMPHAIRLHGPVAVARVRAALSGIARRHEVLRTHFPLPAGAAGVQIVEPPRPVPLPVVDVSEAGEPAARRVAAAEALRPFDLTHGPVWRARLLRLGPTDHVLLLTLHHIVSDGWSMGLLAAEFSELYAAAAVGRAARLRALTVQYADYAVWQQETLRAPVRAEDLAYWTTQLADLLALALPTDRPRPAVARHRGAVHPAPFDAATTTAIQAASQREGVTVFMLLLAAWQLLLARLAGQWDVAVGTPVANRTRTELEPLIGLFVNTLVLRQRLRPTWTGRDLLGAVRATTLAAYDHAEMPFEQLVEALAPPRDLSRAPLFQVMIGLDTSAWTPLELGGSEAQLWSSSSHVAQFDLSLWLKSHNGALIGVLEYATDLIAGATAARLIQRYRQVLATIMTTPQSRLDEISLLTDGERSQLLIDVNRTDAARDAGPAFVHELFEAQVRRQPDAIALVCGSARLTYHELNARSNQVAHKLRQLGVGPEVRVALYSRRDAGMLIGLLGIMKAGGAYVPLDPSYPAERVHYIIQDSQAAVVVTNGAAPSIASQRPTISLQRDGGAIEQQRRRNPRSEVRAGHLAYVIYTSGSTGRPKGVAIPHGALSNFHLAMDRIFPRVERQRWCSVTSISFDISVLELFWTLSRGDEILLDPEPTRMLSTSTSPPQRTHQPAAFGLFYFAATDSRGGADKYRLLLEGARAADRHGFDAVWTPERHFHPFGGLYPNPSVTGAAVAAVTKRIRIRAGSVVLPLHDPLRVAEEWSVVDNLSGGRVQLSFASGWHANDFVLSPAAFAERRQRLLRDIDTVRRLWRGERVSRTNGIGQQAEIEIYPKPLQPELPVWLTSAGSADTFRLAGEIGAGVLTHLLGQDLAELAEKIAKYRAAYAQARHRGTGRIALMLHTFVGDDLQEVRELVREPFCRYLAESADLMATFGRAMGYDVDSRRLSPEDWAALIGAAFDRYVETSSLIGDEEKCLALLRQIGQAGVDEVACLIDFGVADDRVLTSLSSLAALRDRWMSAAHVDAELPKGAVLQCTPSFATAQAAAWSAQADARVPLRMLVGGEALSRPLADTLLQRVHGGVFNMYGPTETTVWSTVHELQPGAEVVPIGRPIANTQVYVLDERLQPAAIGTAGDLYIGGDGLARGYVGQPDATALQFLPNPFGSIAGSRLYRTNDRARWRVDLTLEYLGRADRQVKLHGYRVEPAEIEAALLEACDVRDAAVLVRQDAGDQRLVAYVIPGERGTRSVAATRAALGTRLPEYMIPSVFVFLESFPLTPNGKLDPRALPSPEPSSGDAPPVEARTDVERTVARVWREVLKLDRVDIFANFFELGGHSLAAILVVSRIQHAFDIDIGVKQLFMAPTISGLALVVERELARMRNLVTDIENLSDDQVRALLSAELDSTPPSSASTTS